MIKPNSEMILTPRPSVHSGRIASLTSWAEPLDQLRPESRLQARVNTTTEVVVTSTDAGQVPHPGGHKDLVPLDQLIRETPGAHPITSIDELRSDAFDTDEELAEFLAFVTKSRRADLA